MLGYEAFRCNSQSFKNLTVPFFFKFNRIFLFLSCLSMKYWTYILPYLENNYPQLSNFITVYSSVICPLILVSSVCTAQYIPMYHWYFCSVFTKELHFITHIKSTVRIVSGQIDCRFGYTFRLWLLIVGQCNYCAKFFCVCFWTSFAISA